MGFRKRKDNILEQAEKAYGILVEEEYLRQLYDYDLETLIHAIEGELQKRQDRKTEMINSIGEMFSYMERKQETQYSFHYKPMSPKELLEQGCDITDEGYYRISKQLGEDGKKVFPYGKNKALSIRAYPGVKEGEWYYEVEIVTLG